MSDIIDEYASPEKLAELRRKEEEFTKIALQNYYEKKRLEEEERLKKKRLEEEAKQLQLADITYNKRPEKPVGGKRKSRRNRNRKSKKSRKNRRKTNRR